jgi:nickel-dependent lactate racemase
MTTIEIPCGRGTQTLSLDERRLRACLTPAPPARPAMDQSAIVQNALEHPVGTPRLCELARGRRSVVLITSDHTRPVPSAITLPPYLREIRKGSPDANVTVLVATGMHRSPTPDEMRAKFSPAVCEREKIVVHNAFDDGAMAFFGTLPSGGELWLNRLVRDADLVVSEGFVEPHFFAGYSGGRKSILPGVAAKKTVLYNHNAAFIRDPLARQGILEGNPIHRDMAFAAKAAQLAFILNVLLDGDKRIIAAFAGDPEQAHARGCEACGRMNGVPAVQADIVVTSNGGYPLDQNLYQCVKGMTTAESCVREGGVIILCAGLEDGCGGDAFYHWFHDRADASRVTRDIQNVPAGDTAPDQWQAQILARVQQKAACYIVTGPENRQLIEDMHMRFFPGVNDALEYATRALGADAAVTVIPDGVSVIVRQA